ncbi:hypothetical protein [Rubritalea tangerina]|uniref:hypothetical protein n=1 Tax=Rubritalea tangerina TaxID=430798 RepID=UPI0036144E1D
MRNPRLRHLRASRLPYREASDKLSHTHSTLSNIPQAPTQSCGIFLSPNHHLTSLTQLL